MDIEYTFNMCFLLDLWVVPQCVTDIVHTTTRIEVRSTLMHFLLFTMIITREQSFIKSASFAPLVCHCSHELRVNCAVLPVLAIFKPGSTEKSMIVSK